ncbi:MAG: hypothetical protein ACP5KW_08520 [Thermoproteota archaeon]
MCGLLGAITNKPVDLEFSLKLFKKFVRGIPMGMVSAGMKETSQKSLSREQGKEIERLFLLPWIRCLGGSYCG